MHNDWNKALKILKKGGVIVAPTDTLYGILVKADNKKAVERVYKIKGRDKGKPCIVLITSLGDLKKFGLKLPKDGEVYRFLEHVWPDKVSVVLPCPSPKWRYIHRGTKAIAFRMVSPKNKNLYSLLQKVGSLVAPSANPQGLEPARSLAQAQMYFKDSIDLYVNGGTRNIPPSTLVSLLGPKPKVLRQGSVNIFK